MKKSTIVFIVLLAVMILLAIFGYNKEKEPTVTPNPNNTGGVTNPPQPAQKDDLIVVEYPLPGATISSPLVITGKARGNWYFEASFPIVLTDWDGKIIAQGYAEALDEWMTTEYVPFKATLNYTKPDTSVSKAGILILQKSNASGEPRFDNALEIWINFES